MKDRVYLMTSTQWYFGLKESGKRTLLSHDWSFPEIRDANMTYSIEGDFKALYERVTTACAKGREIEDDLVSFREQQKVKIHEIQVSHCQVDGDVPWGTE